MMSFIIFKANYNLMSLGKKYEIGYYTINTLSELNWSPLHVVFFSEIVTIFWMTPMNILFMLVLQLDTYSENQCYLQRLCLKIVVKFYTAQKKLKTTTEIIVQLTVENYCTIKQQLCLFF